jgi:hypothetical protein
VDSGRGLVDTRGLPMDPLVASLIQFRTGEEILALWQQVFEAHAGGLSTTVVITSSQQDASAHAGIVLDRPELRMNFIRACQAALAALEVDLNPLITGGDGGHPHVRFDRSPVRI